MAATSELAAAQFAAQALQDAPAEQGGERQEDQRTADADSEDEQGVLGEALFGQLRRLLAALPAGLADGGEAGAQRLDQRPVGVTQGSVNHQRVFPLARLVLGQHLVVEQVQFLGQAADLGGPAGVGEAAGPVLRFQRLDLLPEGLPAGDKLGLALVELGGHVIAQQHRVESALLGLEGALRATDLRQCLTGLGDAGRDVAHIVAEGLQAEQCGQQEQHAEGAADADHGEQAATDGKGIEKAHGENALSVKNISTVVGKYFSRLTPGDSLLSAPRPARPATARDFWIVTACHSVVTIAG
jgi:hypothetical protein